MCPGPWPSGDGSRASRTPGSAPRAAAPGSDRIIHASHQERGGRRGRRQPGRASAGTERDELRRASGRAGRRAAPDRERDAPCDRGRGDAHAIRGRERSAQLDAGRAAGARGQQCRGARNVARRRSQAGYPRCRDGRRPRRGAAFRPRLPSATTVGIQFDWRLKNARFSISIAPLKTRPERERGERAGDDDRLVRRERPALVEEADDRLGEHRGDDARRDRAGSAIWRRPVESVLRKPSMSPRAASRARATGRAPSRPRPRTCPAGACRRGTPCRSRSARGSRSIRRDANSVSMTALKLIRPRPSVTGTISVKTCAHRRVAPVEHELQPAVETAQPRDRQQHLDHRADEDRAGVDVELRVSPCDMRHAEHEAGDDREVPGDRRQRRDA